MFCGRTWGIRRVKHSVSWRKNQGNSAFLKRWIQRCAFARNSVLQAFRLNFESPDANSLSGSTGVGVAARAAATTSVLPGSLGIHPSRLMQCSVFKPCGNRGLVRLSLVSSPRCRLVGSTKTERGRLLPPVLLTISIDRTNDHGYFRLSPQPQPVAS